MREAEPFTFRCEFDRLGKVRRRVIVLATDGEVLDAELHERFPLPPGC
jgi:hypothetical protein